MNDEVKCAYTVPYSYSALQAHLKQLKLLCQNKGKFQERLTGLDKCLIRFESLGTSLGNLEIPLLRISNFDSAIKRAEEKPIILIIGR